MPDSSEPQDLSPFSRDRPDQFVGSILSERYQILEVLGKGGMGFVFKGRHLLVDRFVAIKVLRSNLLNDEVTKKRFQQEAKAAGGMSHQNLISVFDYGFASDEGHPYIVMDFLEGHSLEDAIKAAGVIPLDRFARIVTQTCKALNYIHKRGVVHRDLKPSNIMIVPTDDDPDFVKVVDFGIAKVMTSEAEETMQRLTVTGQSFGSPLYMSPEQCMGKEVDQRSDIYSLGCVMFEMLTGVPPISGDNPLQTLYMHCNLPPKTLAETNKNVHVPDVLQTIVMRCLEKDPARRWETAKHLNDAIAKLKLDVQVSGTHQSVNKAAILQNQERNAAPSPVQEEKPRMRVQLQDGTGGKPSAMVPDTNSGFANTVPVDANSQQLSIEQDLNARTMDMIEDDTRQDKRDALALTSQDPANQQTARADSNDIRSNVRARSGITTGGTATDGGTESGTERGTGMKGGTGSSTDDGTGTTSGTGTTRGTETSGGIGSDRGVGNHSGVRTGRGSGLSQESSRDAGDDERRARRRKQAVIALSTVLLLGSGGAFVLFGPPQLYTSILTDQFERDSARADDLYDNQDYDGAEKLYRSVLPKARALLKSPNKEVANILYRLAVSMHETAKGTSEEVNAHLAEAQSIIEALDRKNPLSKASFYTDILFQQGNVLEEIDEPLQAMKKYKQILELRKREAKENPRVASANWRLGALLYSLNGSDPKAIETLQLALDGYMKQQVPDFKSTQECGLLLAAAQSKSGKYADAKQTIRDVEDYLHTKKSTRTYDKEISSALEAVKEEEANARKKYIVSAIDPGIKPFLPSGKSLFSSDLTTPGRSNTLSSLSLPRASQAPILSRSTPVPPSLINQLMNAKKNSSFDQVTAKDKSKTVSTSKAYNMVHSAASKTASAAASPVAPPAPRRPAGAPYAPPTPTGSVPWTPYDDARVTAVPSSALNQSKPGNPFGPPYATQEALSSIGFGKPGDPPPPPSTYKAPNNSHITTFPETGSNTPVWSTFKNYRLNNAQNQSLSSNLSQPSTASSWAPASSANSQFTNLPARTLVRNRPLDFGAMMQRVSSGGVKIVGFRKNSPASQLQRGDIILGVDGLIMDTPRNVNDAILKHNFNDIVLLSVLRQGQQITVTIRL
jgi:serine/threonine protein kinase/tetratricopeptide (TPR) repeat protein